jgi:hypothetical protein
MQRSELRGQILTGKLHIPSWAGNTIVADKVLSVDERNSPEYNLGLLLAAISENFTILAINKLCRLPKSSAK